MIHSKYVESAKIKNIGNANTSHPVEDCLLPHIPHSIQDGNHDSEITWGRCAKVPVNKKFVSLWIKNHIEDE